MIYLASVLVLLWLLVGGYLLFLLNRQRVLERTLTSLRRQWEEERSREDSPSS